METSRQRRGRLAEDLVLAAAKKRGLKLVERNFHTRYGELDIVLTDNEQLVVVEVRYRAREDFGQAVATVTPAKQKRIIAATKGFLTTYNKWQDVPVRFDVAGVDANDQINWIENAFLVE